MPRDTLSAPQLLDYEPRAADQVPLLMNMQENEIALVKAIESGDSDLGPCCVSRPPPTPRHAKPRHATPRHATPHHGHRVFLLIHTLRPALLSIFLFTSLDCGVISLPSAA